ncbi:uncharacterized protein BJ171DRAFT_526144 [Polychytrium aggregatum]|uniref:uncharacterized protein n=1 Tax=Polychytrium aggregatum TaxID=110093 RepID=UPI0022FE7D6D|nr:uncharacterized protein BJ171DRAFT_526144 [Polychytrium aggregatum]KAI9193526.1 hypothetical protein BJ171DRAFT_526144 [Polychytrium aggregatum]
MAPGIFEDIPAFLGTKRLELRVIRQGIALAREQVHDVFGDGDGKWGVGDVFRMKLANGCPMGGMLSRLGVEEQPPKLHLRPVTIKRLVDCGKESGGEWVSGDTGNLEEWAHWSVIAWVNRHVTNPIQMPNAQEVDRDNVPELGGLFDGFEVCLDFGLSQLDRTVRIDDSGHHQASKNGRGGCLLGLCVCCGVFGCVHDLQEPSVVETARGRRRIDLVETSYFLVQNRRLDIETAILVDEVVFVAVVDFQPGEADPKAVLNQLGAADEGFKGLAGLLEAEYGGDVQEPEEGFIGHDDFSLGHRIDSADGGDLGDMIRDGLDRGVQNRRGRGSWFSWSIIVLADTLALGRGRGRLDERCIGALHPIRLGQSA